MAMNLRVQCRSLHSDVATGRCDIDTRHWPYRSFSDYLKLEATKKLAPINIKFKETINFYAATDEEKCVYKFRFEKGETYPLNKYLIDWIDDEVKRYSEKHKKSLIKWS